MPIFGDITELKGTDVGPVDVICGGFPCQDLSLAGKGAGLSGARSGLWYEYLRLIDETRPQWAIIENVPALRSRGLDEVLRGLTEVGYDAEWHCIPASAVGAPHRRDRVWVLAYPNGQRLEGVNGQGESQGDSPGGSHGQPRPLLTSIAAADWLPQPGVCRVAHGVPNRAHRLKQLGNSVVPQLPELIGRAILASEA